MFLTTKTALKKGGCLMENSIHQSKTIYNYLKNLNLCSVFSHTVIKHILSILISVFSMGYNGKTVDFEKYSSCYAVMQWNCAELYNCHV